MLTVSWFNEEGEEVTATFPHKNEVCPRCEGEGGHLTPSIGNHAYSQEEFEEAFDDEESRAAYFQRGGMYDVQCEVCHGNKVVPIVDEDKLNPEQKKLFAEYEEYMEEKASDDAADRRTRWMEDGCPMD